MKDISWKVKTLRTATAQAIVKVGNLGMEAINNKTVPKGDPFEISKIAGMLAVKNTAGVIPHCHPMPTENTDIDFEISGNEITIELSGISNSEIAPMTSSEVTSRCQVFLR